MTQAVRPTAVAGAFYPQQAPALQSAVAAHLARARTPAPELPCPKLLLVPHAGYVYSGDIAASAYRLLVPYRDQLRRVVLLGPVHRVPVQGMAAPTVAAFATPLGPVAVDHAALAALADLPQVLHSDRPHMAEHALEVQLPFLQTVLAPGFSLLPLAVGAAEPAAVAEVLERLWGGPETLLVISSDLSHYLPDAAAKARDASTVERILRLATDLAGQDACGARALNGAMLCVRRHRLQPMQLDVRTSADTAGRGHERVVGYAAIAFFPPAEAVASTLPEAGASANASPGPPVAVASTPFPTPHPPVCPPPDERVLATATTAGAAACPPDPRAQAATAPGKEAGSQLGQALLATARAAIAAKLLLPFAPAPEHPALRRRGASFVTLHDASGQLRGCIGRLQAQRNLGADVAFNAVAAAFNDPRFQPVTAAEWPNLALEVSVLTPLQRLAGTATLAEAAALLRPGTDGVMLAWRKHQATFLPQVWAQLPEARQFLRRLLAKAGLPTDFWAPDVQVSRYQVLAWEGPTVASRSV